MVELNIASHGLAKAITFKSFQDSRLLELADDEIVWGGVHLNRTITIPVLDATLGDYVVNGKVLNVNGLAVKGLDKPLRKWLVAKLARVGRERWKRTGSKGDKRQVRVGECPVCYRNCH